MSNVRTKYRVGEIEEEFEISEISELNATEIFLKILKNNNKEE